MKGISNCIPYIYYIFFFFRCTFQQSFNVFSGKQGLISSIAITDGNFVVFVNDLKDGKYQEYTQKVSVKGALIGDNVAMYEGTSSPIPSKIFAYPFGGYYVLFLRDTADSNGYFSYIAYYQNDMTQSRSENYLNYLLYGRATLFFKGPDVVYVNSKIYDPTDLNNARTTCYSAALSGSSDINIQNSKDFYFKKFLSYTDINEIELNNGKHLIILSAKDSATSSFYLLLKIVSFASQSAEDFGTAIKIDSSAPASGINHLYTQLAKESSTGNIMIVYQSSGETLSSNSVVKYLAVDSTASTYQAYKTFLTDSDSSNAKFPKVVCLNNQKCIISWINVDGKISFQILSSDGQLSGSTIIGPKIEQPTDSKSGSLIQIPNSNNFMYFHSMATTNNVVGWIFNSDCKPIYTTVTCKFVLSADQLTCTSIDNCVAYKSDRSACIECENGYELDSNLCVKQGGDPKISHPERRICIECLHRGDIRSNKNAFIHQHYRYEL